MGAAAATRPAAAAAASRFLWVSSGEPHAIRRRELLSKYGDQIRKLYGYDHATAYQVCGFVIVCEAVDGPGGCLSYIVDSDVAASHRSGECQQRLVQPRPRRTMPKPSIASLRSPPPHAHPRPLPQVLAVVATQFLMAWLVRAWAWPALAVVAYVVSGTLNQNLFCAQHEISHFLALKKPSHNRWLALVGNLPLVVPVAVKFREYHHDHHIFLVRGGGRGGGRVGGGRAVFFGGGGSGEGGRMMM